MKRIFKLIALCLAVGIIASFFCGCDFLDDLKDIHVVLSDDFQSAEFKGKNFKRLPDGIHYYFNDSYSNLCYAATKDIPLLLIEDYGTNSYYDPLNGILAVTNYNDNMNLLEQSGSFIVSSKVYEDTKNSDYIFFCDENNFEEYSAIDPDDANRIGYYNSNYDYSTYILSSTASAEILSFVNGNKNDHNLYLQVMDMNASDCVYPIYKCNKSLTIREILSDLEIYLTNDTKAYLISYDKEMAVELSSDTAKELRLSLGYLY